MARAAAFLVFLVATAACCGGLGAEENDNIQIPERGINFEPFSYYKFLPQNYYATSSFNIATAAALETYDWLNNMKANFPQPAMPNFNFQQQSGLPSQLANPSPFSAFQQAGLGAAAPGAAYGYIPQPGKINQLNSNYAPAAEVSFQPHVPEVSSQPYVPASEAPAANLLAEAAPVKISPAYFTPPETTSIAGSPRAFDAQPPQALLPAQGLFLPLSQGSPGSEVAASVGREDADNFSENAGFNQGG
jgi:hypothetical protein